MKRAKKKSWGAVHVVVAVLCNFQDMPVQINACDSVNIVQALHY